MSFTISTPSLLSGQGIDVASTVQQLVTAARAPEQNWQNEQSQILQGEGVVAQINSDLSTLLINVNNLQDAGGALESVSATSGNNSVVTATATAGTALGTHVVVVNNLSSTASYYSGQAGLKSTDSLGTGSFDLTVGGTTQTVQLNNQNLTQLAKSINAMTFNGQPLGVTASVITDSVGAHLVIVANNSGAAGAFTVDGTNAPNLGLTLGSSGKDASATIDGIPVYSASNTVTGAIPGVTLQLQSAAPGQEVQIQTQADTQAATQAVNDFVNSYNAIMQELNAQFAVTQNSSGATTTNPLESDSTTRMVQQQLQGFMTQTFGTDSTYNTLGSLGISMNDDGTLSVNSTQLSTAVNSDYSGVVNFFQGTSGFATGLSTQLTQLTSPTKGAFNLDLQGMQSTYSSLQDQINSFETYISSEQQMWLQEYTQLNVALLQWPFQQQMMNTLFGTSTENSNSSSSQ
jgi:flagellar hook-associated protein 2